jgi:hypothetical protein
MTSSWPTASRMDCFIAIFTQDWAIADAIKDAHKAGVFPSQTVTYVRVGNEVILYSSEGRVVTF